MILPSAIAKRGKVGITSDPFRGPFPQLYSNLWRTEKWPPINITYDAAVVSASVFIWVPKLVKVKVVKWCRKKWNEHNLMYIYHKQCEIKQKIQWNSSNGQLHWFLIDFLWKWSIMDQNYANANAFFSVANIFKRYPGMPYESWCPAVSENVVFFMLWFF